MDLTSLIRRIAQLRRIQNTNIYLEHVISRNTKLLMQNLDGTNQH